MKRKGKKNERRLNSLRRKKKTGLTRLISVKDKGKEKL